MGTINGMGTMYYGWCHNEDGTAEATKWFVFIFLPIIPLKTHKLQLLHNPDDEKTVSPTQVLGAILPHKEISDSYTILEVLPLNWNSVIKTYAKAFIGMPLLLGVPLAIIILIFKLIKNYDSISFWFINIGILVWIGYAFAAIATIFHRSRGGRK